MRVSFRLAVPALAVCAALLFLAPANAAEATGADAFAPFNGCWDSRYLRESDKAEVHERRHYDFTNRTYWVKTIVNGNPAQAGSGIIPKDRQIAVTDDTLTLREGEKLLQELKPGKNESLTLRLPLAKKDSKRTLTRCGEKMKARFDAITLPREAFPRKWVAKEGGATTVVFSEAGDTMQVFQNEALAVTGAGPVKVTDLIEGFRRTSRDFGLYIAILTANNVPRGMLVLQGLGHGVYNATIRGTGGNMDLGEMVAAQ